MLSELAPYIILAVYGILMTGPLCVDTFRTPRDVFIGLSSVGLLVCDAVWGASFSMQPIVLMLVGWWVLSAVQAPRPHAAFTNTIPLIGSVIVAAHIQYSLPGFMLLVLSGVVSAIYGVLQTRKIDVFARSSQPQKCIGCHGITIQHGGYLLLCIGLSLVLATQVSLWWLFSTAIMLGALWLTKSRGAFLGLVAGGLLLAVAFGSWMWWAVFAFILLIGPIAIRAYRPELFDVLTAAERRNYWRVAAAQIIRKPVFGVGADQFGERVPYLQRELNQQSNGKFLLPTNYNSPWPTRAHSDVIQWAVEWGIVGVGLFVLLLENVIFNMPNVWMLAGLVAFLVAGLTFHFHTLRTTNGIFWTYLFIGLSNVSGVSLPPFMLWTLAVVMVLFVVRFSVRELGFDITYHTYLRYLRQKSPPLKPLKWKPESSAARMEACLFWARQGKPWQILKHISYILTNFDGSQRLWEVWNLAGVAFMMSRHFDFAERCFDRALTFLPSYMPARQNLENLRNLKLGALK